MKKFTRDFLLGELGIWCHLRKIGLGLVLVFLTTFAFAQGNQVTYQLKVGGYDNCYRIDNTYQIPVYMQDFLKIKQFALELTFPNVTDFDFTGVTGVHPSLSTATFAEAGGKITMNWSSTTPVTLEPVGEDIRVFTLKFTIPAYLHHYSVANQFVFQTALNWSKVELWNDAGQCDILNSNIFNNSLKVTEKWQEVVVDGAVANCEGDNVTVEVTTPAHVDGMLYSFNGDTYMPLNKSEVYAPSVDNQLIIQDASCISYIKKFDVEAVTPLTFTVASPVYTLCPGGNGDIEIVAKNGTKPYIYYVVPESQWEHGDQVYQHLRNGNKTILNKYTFSNYVVQRPPGIYWVAVQDANDCVPISGSYMMASWKTVEVIDNLEPIEVTDGEDMKLMTTCFGQDDGRIQFSISGGTPYEEGYHVSVNGVYVGKRLVYDSNVDVLCGTIPCNKEVLEPGKYTFVITDANGCEFTVEYTVEEPDKIVFEVDHTDAGCDEPVGEIWIREGSISGGSGDLSDWRWHYTTDPSWKTNVSPWYSLDTRVTDVPAGVYYVEVEDGNGCRQVWENEIGDDAIKVLTTEFDIVYTPIKCYGETTKVTITLVSGDANHEFAYKVEKEVCEESGGVVTCTWEVVGTEWQTSNVFTGIVADVKYRYSVWDKTADCVVSWEQILTQPTPVVATPLTALMVPPSCPGNIDGNIAVVVEGGTPWPGNVYKFIIDDRPASMAEHSNDFAVGAGTYTITVADANGCLSEPVVFEVPDGENYIEFQDKVYLQCAGDEINLFNSDPYDEDDLYEHVGLDEGFMTDFSWYPEINHTGDGEDADMFSYWTSATGWVLVPFQGNIWERNPKLWVSTTASTIPADIVANGEIVDHETSLGAGTYYLVAKDEWGCYSNIEKIEIIDAIPLSIVVTETDATCANTWTGEIKVEAFSGGGYCIPTEFTEPNGSECVKYQYVLVQQPDIFDYPNWYGEQVTWKNFRNNNSLTNDSVLTLAVQKGTYWIAVRSYCAIHDPSQIKIVGPIEIDGFDPIVGKATTTWVSCFGEKDGTITATATGGDGNLTFTLSKTGFTTVKNQTGLFSGLGAGVYTLTVSDKTGCTPHVIFVEVKEPAKLVLDLQKVDVSCKGYQDGIIRYTITGGTPPYQESTNNGDNWYEIALSNDDVTIYDKRARAGVYVVMIKDANGCQTEGEIELLEPAALTVSMVAKNVSCAQPESCGKTNETKDGTMKVTWGGGWNDSGNNDLFVYQIKLLKGTVQVGSHTSTVAGNYTFTGLSTGNYTATVVERATSLYPKPIILDPDYIADEEAYKLPESGKQNGECMASATKAIEAPAPIAYDVQYFDVKCHETLTGEIKITGVTGGVPPYKFKIEGPDDVPPSLTGWKDAKKPTDNFYTFTGLPWGHYNVFVKDANNCEICLEAGTIHNVDSLELIMELVNNVTCHGTATGKIKVNATGGTPDYEYAIALASDVAQYLFPLDDAAFLASLAWQDSPEFLVPAGEWIGYVRDANSCVQGHATDADGKVIQNHRVTVNEPVPVVGTVSSGSTFETGMTSCFGEDDGKIKVVTLVGGDPAYSAHVTGFDYTGAPVDQWYSNVKAGSWMNSLKASTNRTEKIPDAEKYTVVFIDVNGCESEPVKVAVMQPTEFDIELYVTQDAFICPDDIAGIFEIRILSGGIQPVTYRYEAWDGNVKKFESQYGAVNIFQGPGGLTYKVWAKDANGCVDYAEEYVSKPAEIKFVSFEDMTCFGDPTATVKVTVSGEPGRTYDIYYKKFPATTWTKFNGSFENEIVVTGLTYGHESDQMGHYWFKVIDNMGCEKVSQEITFVPVQQKLQLSVCCIEELECTGFATITVGGGTLPYTVTVAGDLAQITEDGSYRIEYPAGTHEIVLTDAHGCVATTTFVINANPVVREAEFHAYKWEEAAVVDAEAGLDTTLLAGTYEFKYDYNDCERTLVVTVIDDLVHTATIAEIQGTGETSPLLEAYRQITGTVTGVVPGVGYFVQDAVAPWSGIWVVDAFTSPVIGIGITVDGVVAEVNSVTTLNAAKAVLVNAPLTITAIEVDSPVDAKQEKYESVLVKVVGARFQGTPLPDGSWVIKTLEDNTITVNDWMYPYVPVDGHFYTVTGIVNGAHDLYKLEPRIPADVVDLSATTDVIDPTNLEFNVYPNPFRDVLNIENSDRLTRVTVTNIAGQRVIDVQNPESIIRTSNLVTGVYIITLFNEDGIVKSDRMVKQ